MEAQKKTLAAKKRTIRQRAVSYERRYRAEQSINKAQRKEANAHGNFYCEPESRIAFAVRIRGINDMPPKPKKILEILRLKGIFNGTFVKLNKSSQELLRIVAPYIAWGYPSVATVKKLILKRGYGKWKGQRIRLSNELIEKVLGRYASPDLSLPRLPSAHVGVVALRAPGLVEPSPAATASRRHERRCGDIRRRGEPRALRQVPQSDARYLRFPGLA